VSTFREYALPEQKQDMPLSEEEELVLGGDSSQQSLLSWLKTLEQQDADMIVVDHIASAPVMSHSIRQAASRLVLGAFDFKQVFDVLAYCLDCQIKPSVLASRIYALIAQHTLHLLCEECKREDTTEFAQQILNQLSSEVVEQWQEPLKIFHPEGCSACHMTGYTDRMVLFEVLLMEPWLKEMLVGNRSITEIRDSARKHNFVSLEQKSVDVLLAGKTSIEQILSVIAQKV
jgi:type II secretory ATPase GspE/PulE/Tfp pilus assembly ATPase PilB-like protein